MRKVIFTLLSVLLITYSCENKHSVEEKSEKRLKAESAKLFKQISSQETNIEFKNTLTETVDLNIINYHYFYNGGGVAAGDINNDGLIDLLFTANQQPDRLYLNKGNLKFEDITQKLGDQNDDSWSTGVSMVDINADGLLDIYICKSGNLPAEKRRNKLYINKGDLNFEEKSSEYGLDDAAYSTQAAFLDYDQDGDLDMFLLNHEIKPISNYNRDIRNSYDPNVGDKLYRNDQGKFTEVSKEAGIQSSPYGFGLGVGVSDLNQDGWPDIYVSNDFLENDFLYYNNQDGTFTESIKKSTKHISNYGMGLDLADFNNDAKTDILVVDMVASDNYRQKTNMSGMNPERFWQSIKFGFHYQYMYNTLQLNRGKGRFSEVGQMAGVSNTDWSWAALFADLDLDGKKDIFITNGLRKDVRNNDFVKKYVLYADQMPENAGLSQDEIIKKQLRNMPSQKIRNYAFQNKGELNFENKNIDWGLHLPTFSNGGVYADLDNDGDLDLVINNIDDEALVYLNQNEKINGNNFLKVRLKGSDKNTFGIGAKIFVNQNQVEQVVELYQSRGYQSSVPPEAVFGLGKSDQVESIKVLWPDGKTSVVKNAEPNQTIVIDYSTALEEKNESIENDIVFENITKKLNVNHGYQENLYDDFQDQVLLPHKLSSLGPCLEVGDVNGDGLEDFIIGGAHVLPATLFIQTQGETFTKISDFLPNSHNSYEDLGIALFDVDNDGDLDLYMASGGYEFDFGSSDYQDRLYINDGKGNFSFNPNALPVINSSTSVVLPIDFDEDGDLDLFVGGRLSPKKYPLSPKSYFLENNNGAFTDVTHKLLKHDQNIGMITAATWKDLDNDDKNELVLTGEWMPIVILKQNDKNQFERLSLNKLGLDYSNGWWYSVNVVDYDQDGDLDIIAGNLGLNYKYKTSKSEPFKVYAEDFDADQNIDIVLSYAQNGEYYPVRGRECSSQQLSFIENEFPTYNSFASANIAEVLGEDNIQSAKELNAYTFATTIFQNENGYFKAKELPAITQLSSVNAIISEDLNKDGKLDLILGGNMYGSEVETPRNDASYGSVLIQSDDYEFDVIDASSTNFFGEGDLKSMKSISIGNKYQAYIIGQNSGYIKIFRFVNTN